MRKRIKGRKLSRKEGQRKALLRSLARALFLKERIKTTEAKAKELAVFAEKQISIAKRGDLPSRRLLLRHFSKDIVKKLMEEVGKRYKGRNGGYTRITKIGLRKNDGAKMVLIEMVK